MREKLMRLATSGNLGACGHHWRAKQSALARVANGFAMRCCHHHGHRCGLALRAAAHNAALINDFWAGPFMNGRPGAGSSLLAVRIV